MTINFDMDGTLVDLYGVENWLPMLRASDTAPYEIAKPMLNFSLLARYLNKLLAGGVEINIISWTSKGGTTEYNERVATAKREYLAKHLPSVHFTNIFIIDYGTPKESISTGILFDDEEKNRLNWNGQAFDEKEIISILKSLIE